MIMIMTSITALAACATIAIKCTLTLTYASIKYVSLAYRPVAALPPPLIFVVPALDPDPEEARFGLSAL